MESFPALSKIYSSGREGGQNGTNFVAGVIYIVITLLTKICFPPIFFKHKHPTRCQSKKSVNRRRMQVYQRSSKPKNVLCHLYLV